MLPKGAQTATPVFVLFQINCWSHGPTTVCFRSSQGPREAQRTLDWLGECSVQSTEEKPARVYINMIYERLDSLRLPQVITFDTQDCNWNAWTHTLLRFQKLLRLKSRRGCFQMEMFGPSHHSFCLCLCLSWLVFFHPGVRQECSLTRTGQRVNCANSSLYWWERLRHSFFFSAIFFSPFYKGRNAKKLFVCIFGLLTHRYNIY